VSAVYLLAKFTRRLTVKRRHRNKQTKRQTNNKKTDKETIGVTSYGAMGHLPPLELGNVEKFGSFK